MEEYKGKVVLKMRACYMPNKVHHDVVALH